MKLNPQLMLNLIAKTAMEVDFDKDSDYLKLENIVGAYKLSIQFKDSELPLINELMGIDLSTGEVFDEDQLKETADNQIDAVQARNVEAYMKLLADEKAGKTPALDTSLREEIIDNHISIGYTVIDHKMTLTSDNEQCLNTLKSWIENDRELEAYVDVDMASEGLIVSYPAHLKGKIEDNIEPVESMHEARIQISVEQTPQFIPGLKNVADLERLTSTKEEMKKLENERSY